MTIEEIQQEIVGEFSIFDDWMDKYNYLIDLGKGLEGLDPKYKTKDYLIEGCQSKVWIKADLEGGKIIYTADSDAIITKGIIALLVRVFSKQNPADIMKTELGFIDEIGLSQNLSPTRSNGLLAMIKQIKLYAIAYNAKMNT